MLNYIDRTVLFNLFKYTVYCLLALNVVLFFQEEWLATRQTFSQGMTLGQIIEGFAATIDTAAWVLLLLLFELETYVLDDKFLKKKSVEWTSWILGGICYLFILYAFYGYCLKTYGLYQLTATDIVDACALLANGASDISWSIIETLDEYPALTVDNCQSLATNTPIFQLRDEAIIGTMEQWQDIHYLAWIDIINAGNWLILVLLLELDVWLKLEEKKSTRYAAISRTLKILIYCTLFCCAAYWGFLGDFLDFWDAFLWLVAFFFIEMNLFKWNDHQLSNKDTP